MTLTGTATEVSAGGAIAVNSGSLVCKGLGSGLAICICGANSPVAAMTRVELPRAPLGDQPERPSLYADTAIPHLIDLLAKKDVACDQIRLAIVGGSGPVESAVGAVWFDLGPKNVESALEVLNRLGIVVTCTDIGGHVSRVVHIDVTSGSVTVKTALGESEIGRLKD